MSFYEQVRSDVLRHGAINNPYLRRFQAGDVTDTELREFAIEFYSFARFFPRILASQLVNTEDEAVADELTRVLYSELGDGIVKHRHELLYRNFLRSIGIDIHAAMTTPMRPSTRAYIEGMETLYSSGSHWTALGASFGLENMAITMWDQLIPGLTCLRAARHPHMDMTYFTFHRQLESEHEKAMAHAIEAVEGEGCLSKATMSEAEKKEFGLGMTAVLDYLEGFGWGWTESRPVRCRCGRSRCNGKVSCASNLIDRLTGRRDRMKRSWISWYDAGVPATSDYPEWTVPDLLRRSASRFPDSPALFFYGTRISFRELNDLTTRCAVGLRRLGVQPGDRVALMLPNIPQAVIAYYGVLKAGGIVSPINPLYVEREIETQLIDSGSETIIALDLFYPRIRAVRERTHLPDRIIITSLRDFLPTMKRLIYPLKARWEKRWVAIHKIPPVYDFLELLGSASPQRESDAPRLPCVESDALAQIQYTGGTTGTAKGVMLTHRNVVVNAMQGRLWCSNFREGKEVFLGAVPLFHCYGLSTCQNLAVATGCEIVLLPRFHADEAVEVIQKHRVTIVSGVPMMFSMITDLAKVTQYDLHSIRVCLCGASPLPAEVQEAFERLSGVKISEGYGLSEAGPTTHCNPIQGEHPRGSMGLPFPDTDARIVDVETGLRDLPIGEAGELIVRGPQVMQGYWKKEADTQAVLRDGWLYTGDIVRRDERGFFFFLDRKKDVIKPWGETVYPREVEEILFQHPAVREAVVVGTPDRHYGEAVKAFVVRKDGCAVTERELIDHCRQSLARFKVPVAVEFRPDLPRTIIGKVLRRALRDEASMALAGAQASHKGM